MEARVGVSGCAFDKLFITNVPHVLEMIFFSLDYKSYKKCLKVCVIWRDLLSTKSSQTKGKLQFHNEVCKDQRQLSFATWNGDTQMAKSLLSSGLLDVNANISRYVNNIILGLWGASCQCFTYYLTGHSYCKLQAPKLLDVNPPFL